MLRGEAAVHTLIRGAFAGLMATGPMTLAMYLGKALGLLHTPPPKQIMASAGYQAGAPPHGAGKSVFNTAWIASHLAYGMGCGSLYVVLRRALPGPPPSRGLIFAGAVWLVSYLGLMPALGLYPPPDKDSKSRVGVMIAAHAVYGVTLAKADARLS